MPTPEQQGTLQKLWAAMVAKMTPSSQPDVELPKDPLAGTVGKLPEMSAAQWQRVANQTRPVTKQELDMLHQRFGQSLNPNMIRVGYDAGSSGTTLGGWVDPKLPSVAFIPSDSSTDPNKTSLPHEFTHIWQNAGGTYNKGIPFGAYRYSPSDSFETAGGDQQADMMQFGTNGASDYVKAHPVGTNPNNLAAMAFLDSLRKSYNPEGDDNFARMGSLNGVTLVNKKGGLDFQDPWTGLSPAEQLRK